MLTPRHAPISNPVNADSLRHNNLHSHSNHTDWLSVEARIELGWREAADTREGWEGEHFFFCAFKSYLEKEDMHFGAPYCCGWAPSLHQAGVQAHEHEPNCFTTVLLKLSFTTFSPPFILKCCLYLNLVVLYNTICFPCFCYSSNMAQGHLKFTATNI